MSVKAITSGSEEDKDKLIAELQTEVRSAIKGVEASILQKKPPGGKDVDISECCKVSRKLLGKYVTLDWGHCLDIVRAKGEIDRYYRDRTRQRPLNIILWASPGSGKSHFVKCLAASMDAVEAVTYNMGATKRIDDLATALESLRNAKVVDKRPMFFLDEFDSSVDNFAMLLPLLWDGELTLGPHNLKIGKVVILLAGSKPVIKTTADLAKNVAKRIIDNKAKPLPSKLADLVSRINGPDLAIPPLDNGKGGKGRKADKVCIAVSLLSRRFGCLEFVPWAVLSFIAKTEFRYGVRSISHLIDEIQDIGEEETELNIEAVKWPLGSPKDLKGSSVAYHLIHAHGLTRAKALAAICDLWKDLVKFNRPVRVASGTRANDFDRLQRILNKFK